MGEHSEHETERLETILAVVLHCLKETFPHDFYRRCAFSARAVRALLMRDGIPAQVIGGRFTALVVGRDDARYALQGFQGGPERYAHMWVETQSRLIDLSPHLLPNGSPFPLYRMPVIAWHKEEPLPSALCYETIDTLGDTVPFSTDPHVAEQAKRFVACCLATDVRAAAPKLAAWLLTGSKSLRSASEGGDRWAQAALSFPQQPIDSLRRVEGSSTISER